MAFFVLDTDHVTLFQRAHPLVRKRVLAPAPGSVVTTMVTVEEQLRGRLKALRQASNGPSLVAAYGSHARNLGVLSEPATARIRRFGV